MEKNRGTNLQETIPESRELLEMYFDSLEAMIEQLVKWGFRRDSFKIVEYPSAKDPRYKRRLNMEDNDYDSLDEWDTNDKLRFNNTARDLISGNSLPERIDRKKLVV